MSQAVIDPPKIETLDDLLERLGSAPLFRVRSDPPPGTATEQDVLELHTRTDRLYELVDGVLVEKGLGFYESRLANAPLAEPAKAVHYKPLGCGRGPRWEVRRNQLERTIPNCHLIV